MRSKCVITFYSTYEALHAEKVLEIENLEFELVPVPRRFSSDCGISLQFECRDKERILTILKEHDVEIRKVFFG
ncbi:MAG: DUF3343 domain-containing protein [bacterium]|nr:DUF3343 domain-containing protein [bacterium]